MCLARCGKTFTVPPGKTIVQILRENAVDVDVSCEEGYCGTCMTRYLDGEPIHSDSVLDEDDQQEFVMICCCRAKSKTLTLDL
ncbi:Phthalate 4,5-dioxygenase oxygenase reductase subunit [compost metagenome]